MLALIVAFGYGIGLNPPIDIHIPSPEEIGEHIEREYEAEHPEIAYDEDGNEIV